MEFLRELTDTELEAVAGGVGSAAAASGSTVGAAAGSVAGQGVLGTVFADSPFPTNFAQANGASITNAVAAGH